MVHYFTTSQLTSGARTQHKTSEELRENKTAPTFHYCDCCCNSQHLPLIKNDLSICHSKTSVQILEIQPHLRFQMINLPSNQKLHATSDFPHAPAAELVSLSRILVITSRSSRLLVRPPLENFRHLSSLNQQRRCCRLH